MSLEMSPAAKLVFAVYCISTIFIALFSITAIQDWKHPWGQISVGLAIGLPLLLLIAGHGRSWIKGKVLTTEFAFLAATGLLGVANIYFSEAPRATLKPMLLFLASGLGSFVVARYVPAFEVGRKRLLYLYWALLLAACVLGVCEYGSRKLVTVFSGNPIPSAALVLLLFSGPVMLLGDLSPSRKFLAVLTIGMGIAIIVLTGTRGAIVALAAMVIAGAIFFRRRETVLLIASAALLFAGGYVYKDHLPERLNRNFITADTSKHRLENLFFALHIYQQKPLFGVGLHSPLSGYLGDYRVRIPRNAGEEPYPPYVMNHKTLDNMVLCSLVGMGGLFTLAYAGFVGSVVMGAWRRARENSESKKAFSLLLILLSGFAVHSLFFDSLVYPHLNWLFHGLLGMAGGLAEG